MARAFLEMDETDMRCARFGRSIDGILVLKSANFDLCVHIQPIAKPSAPVMRKQIQHEGECECL